MSILHTYSCIYVRVLDACEAIACGSAPAADQTDRLACTRPLGRVPYRWLYRNRYISIYVRVPDACEEIACGSAPAAAQTDRLACTRPWGRYPIYTDILTCVYVYIYTHIHVYTYVFQMLAKRLPADRPRQRARQPD